MNESYCKVLAGIDYNQYRISCPSSQFIPSEYQGWLLLGLLGLGIITTIYALYLMSGDETWKQNQKSEK
jgi:hypothetical protein